MEINANFSLRAQEDIDLVSRAVKLRDQAAYAKLMDKYRDSIYFMILKMVHNRDDAEDLTIEAFGKAFNKLHKYSPDYAFSTWLFKIATNNCIDFIRKKRLATTSLDNPIDTDEGGEVKFTVKDDKLTPEQVVMKNQRANIIRKTIAEMSEKYRRLIELRYFEEYSYEEIAEELNIPLGTVKAQLFRAKDLLYKKLKDSKERY